MPRMPPSPARRCFPTATSIPAGWAPTPPNTRRWRSHCGDVDKTFFVYGGTTGPDERHLLCMISYYDHKTHRVPKPVVVHDKKSVNDPHDNPSLAVDADGHLWVFVSGRARARPGFKYRSVEPYSIDRFERVSEEELTYPATALPCRPRVPASVHQVHRCPRTVLGAQRRRLRLERRSKAGRHS